MRSGAIFHSSPSPIRFAAVAPFFGASKSNESAIETRCSVATPSASRRKYALQEREIAAVRFSSPWGRSCQHPFAFPLQAYFGNRKSCASAYANAVKGFTSEPIGIGLLGFSQWVARREPEL